MIRMDKISSRYAKAVYDYLKNETKVRPVIKDLISFSKAIEGNLDLKRVLTTELYSQVQRRAVVEDCVAKFGFGADSKRILLLLSAQGRLSHLATIAERLNYLLLESANVVPLTVSAALELSEEEKKKIEAKFKKVLGKEVEATYKLNPELYGGLKVTASGRTFDGSLSGWLSSLEEKLIGGSL